MSRQILFEFDFLHEHNSVLKETPTQYGIFCCFYLFSLYLGSLLKKLLIWELNFEKISSLKFTAQSDVNNKLADF